MKQIDESFQEKLLSGAVTTCLCWRLERQDGLTVGITDHEHVLTFDEVSYTPGAALTSARFETAGGLRPGRASADGALIADALTEEDLAAGLWTRARVYVYRVDWQETDNRILTWTGFLSEVTKRGDQFEAELISLKAELERPVGRLVSRHCDAALGDARCGLSDVGGQSCDKRFETCRDVFSNAENFRGFPHLPGQDVVLSGPAAAGNDGGHR
ncbi:DUF2163 domain-containing protein [Henriciella barbarensis]|uniref:DUF2163 domain-containing protein n=1 Tax=Henriciella barbarensis TaxID=86342 RepID=A0A399QN71_9PROT|nr:DUF2163 domain-containing protein [Henriciella barbarensis]RIJ20390.1 DUF2163 domain-containing protein [Henriciella barbarensis]